MSEVIFEKTDIKDEETIKDILKQEGYDVYTWQDGKGTHYPWHTHEHEEVRWVVSGEVEIGVGDRVFKLLPGDKIILAPDTPHWAKTEKGVRYVCGSKD
ncbi:MAG: cupin domain-containing protein [Hydrogenobaculum sp.]